MASLTLRVLTRSGDTTKNAPLTNAEIDQNFINIDAELALLAPIDSPTFTGNVGVGTNNPQTLLHVSGSSGVAAGGSTPVAVRIQATDQDGGANSWNTNADFAQLQFHSSDGSLAGGNNIRYSIGAAMENTSGASTGLSFRSYSGGTPTERVRIDSSGNVGVGVVPSTWVASSNPIQIGLRGSVGYSGNGLSFQMWNARESAAGTFRYLTTTGAAAYFQGNGTHSWQVAPSGTAGDPITFTQAMLLDANGDLTVASNITADSFTGIVAASNLTGTVSGDRGVTAGSATSSFVEYNGTTKTAGQFDGGTTAPSNTTRLNYDGYLYATRFYGDGSQLTSVAASTVANGVYTTGSYADPTWITSLAFSKITGSGVLNKNVQVISTNTTAVSGRTYVLTASLTLTLPASPTAGMVVEIINRSGTTTCVVGRNAVNIMGLAEDMTLNDLNATITLTYADATRGWVINL